MFNEKSYLVTTWVDLVNRGIYQKEQVPNISNLREQVFLLLTEKEGV